VASLVHSKGADNHASHLVGNGWLNLGNLVKAISIKQPWVHAILREGKDIENRTWQRSFRGWVAIHASATPRQGARFPRGLTVPDLDTPNYGAICGVARVIDIVTKSRSRWFDQPSRGYVNYGWVLADVRRLRSPVKCHGMLGLWQVPPNVLRSIKRQLPKPTASKLNRDI
jgi:hypothetical protein